MRLTPKRAFLLSILVVFVLVVGFLGMSLFGPSTPVVVSRQTTYLTEPVGPWGNIDYVEAIRRQWSEGVTPEDNAAALIWQAIGPAEILPERRPSFYAELGIPPLPADGEYFLDLHSERMQQRIGQWVRARPDLAVGTAIAGLPPDPDVDPQELLHRHQMQVADATAEFTRWIEPSQHAPWRAEDFPPLVDWLEWNERPLALAVEASKRAKYYSPLMVGEAGSGMGRLISLLLPDVHNVRRLATTLCQRAMLHVGEGRPREAWEDLQAAHRLAGLVGQRGPLINQLVAMSIDAAALRADAALLHEADLSIDEAREIREFLLQLGKRWNVVRSVDQFERLMLLDSISHIARHGTDGEHLGHEGVLLSLLRTGIDWNIPLQMTNHWYDRIAAAMEQSVRADREAALAAIEDELATMRREVASPGAIARALASKSRRSEIVGGLLLSTFLPAINAVHQAEDRSVASLRLVQVAAALAVHRADRGTYPASLDDLASDLGKGLPVDPYTEQPFRYERRGDGYVLWSVGRNLQDDGASGRAFCLTVNGEYVDEGQPADSGEDIVLRVPWSPPTPTDD